MGTGSSKIDSQLDSQREILTKIHSTSMNLSRKFTDKFLNPRFCSSVALIYNNELLKYRKHELNGIAMDLGIVADAPEVKQKVCEKIIEHYTNRLNLIASIQHSIRFCSDRIFALTTGPRCDNDPENFDEAKCVKWSNKVVLPDESVANNNMFFEYLTTMQDDYLSKLAELVDILNQLEDENLDDDGLKDLAVKTESIIDSMHLTCSNLYKQALIAPTRTKAEASHEEELDAFHEGEKAALLAAARKTAGLEIEESGGE